MRNRLVRKSTSLALSLLIVTSAVSGVSSAQFASGQTSAVGVQQQFNDLSKNHWAANSIARWMNHDIIQGYGDGTVRPNAPITRAEFTVIMNKVFGLTQKLNQFISDVPAGTWYEADISKAVQAGYIKLNAAGKSNPHAPLSRAEAAFALDKLFSFSQMGTDSLDTAHFSDLTGMNAEMLEAVNALAAAGYLEGYSDSSFKPQGTMTRAELMTLIDRVITGYFDKKATLSEGTVKGNALINKADITLKDTVIEGNLYLTAGIGDGTAVLQNVVVKGTSFVPDSNAGIQFNGSFKQIVAVPTGNHQPTITISGTVEELKLDGNAKIILAEGAVIKKLTVGEHAGKAVIEGKGKVETITNKSDGLTMNGSKVPKSTGSTSGSGTVNNGGSTPGSGSPGNNNGGGTPGGNNGNPNQDWTLTFANEFNDPSDLQNWTAEIGTGNGGWGNNEQQYYKAENATVENGHLVITAKKEEVEDSQYTSARLVTRDKFSQTYGKFEARIKLPGGTGFWPAFWMMPQDSTYGTWASSGEIDIMESRGRLPEIGIGTLHYGGEAPNNVYTGQEYPLPNNGTATDFHTYAIEWEPGEIRWYIDGILLQTQNDWYSISKNQAANNAYPAPFDQDFYMILNLALGGNFDGGRPIDESLLPGKMYVDYVRAYKLTGRPYREPVPPVIAKEPIPADAQAPLADGNLLYNNNFDQDDTTKPNLKYLNGTGSSTEVPNTDYWSLFEGDGGAGSVNIEKIGEQNYAKIGIKNAGVQNYSVQLLNTASLVKGHFYKVSFDAKSDANRNMMARMTGGESRGFAAYSPANIFDLTDQMQRFEYQFQMKADTDIAARTEFNVGLNTSPVWIGNVRVEEIDTIAIDDDMRKEPLDGDGNRVYNGSFDQGRQDRMTFWHVVTADNTNAKASVNPATRYLGVNILNAGNGNANDVSVLQRGILLEANQTYEWTFDASASTPRDIQVELVSNDGSETYFSKKVSLGSDDVHAASSKHTIDLTMTGITDPNATLAFRLGGADGTVNLDNVKLIQTSIVYDPDTVFFPLTNGSFDSGLAPWEAAVDTGGSMTASHENQAAKLSVSALGQKPWSNMFMQNNMNLTKGAIYELSFDAHSTIERKMEIDIEDSSYTRYFDEIVDLGTSPQNYKFTFKMGKDVLGNLKFFLGNLAGQTVSGPHDVFIDNVVFQIKDAPKMERSPSLVADTTYNVVGQPIEITFQDDETWRKNISSVSINGAKVSEDQYTFAEGRVTLDAALFPNASSYKIRIEAKDYTFASVTQRVMNSDGNLLLNGDFSNRTSDWEVWSDGGSSLAENAGAAVVTIPSLGSGQGWSTQFYQADIPLEAGKTYELSFKASASVERPIVLEYSNTTSITPNQVKFALSTTSATYTAKFTATKPETLKLNFLIGNVTMGSLTTPDAPHTITFDDLSIKETTATTPETPVSHEFVNGDFGNDLSGWQIHQQGVYEPYAGKADISVVDGKAKVDITEVGWFWWHIQLHQDNIALNQGTYKLSLDLSSEQARNIYVQLKDSDNDPIQTFSVDENNKTYEAIIEIPSDGIYQLIIGLGRNGETEDPILNTPYTVWIDNISLEPYTNPIN
ncbi:carbohydrate binding domain-containing protein [Paenibacillus sp. FSL R5-0407]|uniref:carbohydrate binding domain-containing protein n=1 Tax=Paenibacillus TaxID=44249 RepID=UPI0025B6CA17|nr:carbohydrate binding domain-containing protein [Paenibacillus vini]MDN4068181.1 carbohydrate binding domain-containing protein [Paenibacillus vini]